MKNVLAATVLFLYAVSSAGVVLVEYSCHETGTSGLTTPAPRACYAPMCEDTGAEADPCCDHACCEIDVRVSAPGDQVAGPKPAPDATAERAIGANAVLVASGRAPDATGERPPAVPSPGFDRPLRI